MRRAWRKWEDIWGTSSVSEQYTKQSGKLQCTSNMFHTIKHLGFPKRKGKWLACKLVFTLIFSFWNQMRHWVVEVFLEGQNFAIYAFLKVSTHNEPPYTAFLYTYPNTDDAECYTALSFIVLAQTDRKPQNQHWNSFWHHSLNNKKDMEKIWSQKRVGRGHLHFWPVALIIFLEILRLQVKKV